MSYFAERWPEWLALVGEHLWISGLALGAALLIAAPLGILCGARPWAERLATGLTGVLRVIPSLAVLIICVPILGVGDLPAVIALTVLAIPRSSSTPAWRFAPSRRRSSRRRAAWA